MKREVVALYLACKHPSTPWYAKVLAGCVVAYALSPIDLIPDPIPILGYLADLVLIPLGIALALKLIPAHVMVECRSRAREITGRPTSWVGAGVIIIVWVLVAVGLAYVAWTWLTDYFGLGYK